MRCVSLGPRTQLNSSQKCNLILFFTIRSKTADHLIEESGCILEHPSASKFRQHVMGGDWTKADHYLQELQTMIERKQTNFVVNIKPEAPIPPSPSPKLDSVLTILFSSRSRFCFCQEMKFLVLEQKYLEYLEDGRVLDALHVLRNELTPLQYNTTRVHQLSSLMMCANSEELIRRSNWEGKGDVSRNRLIDRLQSYLPPNVMLPPRRLRSLLKQAVEMQAERCMCHDVAWATDLDNTSLLTDHDCGTENVSVSVIRIAIAIAIAV